MVAIHGNHLEAAESMIVRHGERNGLRTLDAIQLAVMPEARGRIGLCTFVVADAALAEIASTEGTVVINPEVG